MDIILPEIVMTGYYNSEISAKGEIVSKGKLATMFELELPVRDGGISYVGTTEVPIRKGTVICTKPGQIHKTKYPMNCYYVHMLLNKGHLYETLLHLPEYVKIDVYGKYEAMFSKLIMYNGSSHEADKMMVYSSILEIIHTIGKESRGQRLYSEPKNAHIEMVNRVIKYISENPSSDLSLEKMAAYVSFSPIHFHNCFKNVTGKTLHEYVDDIRIQKAVHLLITTDMTLSQISYECGFSSQSYFSYAFKRKMKKTPRKYERDFLYTL